MAFLMAYLNAISLARHLGRVKAGISGIRVCRLHTITRALIGSNVFVLRCKKLNYSFIRSVLDKKERLCCVNRLTRHRQISH